MRAFYFSLSICILFGLRLNAQGVPCRNEARIDLVQQQYGLSGKGVLTIMMDRGLDYRHPDFIDANGKTRLAYIYDLYDNSGASDPDNPFGIGTIYDSVEINASLQSGGIPLVNDIYGHGTATTGIFAGDGSAATDPTKFRGIAYQSKIISIIVSKDYVPPFGNNPGQNAQYDPTLLKYAFQFAEAKINELKRPAVTLLNIGSIGDPTDGTSEFCGLVDNYVAHGHIFVCGVGDDGGKNNHQVAFLQEGKTTEFKIQKGDAGFLRFSSWYHEDDRFTYTIERPGGQIEGPFTSPENPTDAKDQSLNGIFIYHRGSKIEYTNSSSDLRAFLIDFSGEAGTYKLTLTTSKVTTDGKIDGFLNPARYFDNNTFLGIQNAGGSINSFSSCLGSFSPGDYVATNKWTDLNGKSWQKTNEGLPGERWIGSASGPTMDGRLGIDIVAPGELAWAAYSTDSYYASIASNKIGGGNGAYGLQTAVSAAAPLTAGVMALILEVNPKLSPDKITTILQETARKDNFTGAFLPDNHWGYGKLDALAAVNAAYATLGNHKILTNYSDFLLYPNPAGNQVQISYPGLISRAAQVELYSVSGQKTGNYKLSENGSIDISHLSSGAYVVYLTVEGRRMAKLLCKR